MTMHVSHPDQLKQGKKYAVELRAGSTVVLVEGEFVCLECIGRGSPLVAVLIDDDGREHCVPWKEVKRCTQDC